MNQPTNHDPTPELDLTGLTPQDPELVRRNHDEDWLVIGFALGTRIQDGVRVEYRVCGIRTTDTGIEFFARYAGLRFPNGDQEGLSDAGPHAAWKQHPRWHSATVMSYIHVWDQDVTAGDPPEGFQVNRGNDA